MAKQMLEKGEILETEFDGWNIRPGKKKVKERYVISNRRSLLLTNSILSGKCMFK